MLSDRPLALAPWDAPPARFPVGAPEDEALAARVRADPVARLARDDRTGQLLLWTYGPEHAEVLLAGLPASPVRVPPGSRPVALRVHVPAWAERAVQRDVSARGGEAPDRDDDPARPGWVVLDVRLPPAEVAGYPLALARASGATGWSAPA